MSQPTSPFALFDDNLTRQGDLLLTDLVDCIECSTPEGLPAAFAAIETARAGGNWVALATAYELGYALERRLVPRLPSDGAPLLKAWVFRDASRRSADETETWLRERLAALDQRERVAGMADLANTITEDDYIRAVEDIKALIEAGDCYQVNFTFALEGRAYGHPLALYERLREAQPVPYGAFIQAERGAILSRSPELFVQREGDTVLCRPMKGTAARETDPSLLAGSEKNRAENVMIVDLIRNDLGRLHPAGGVRVERLCQVEGYSRVWQMTSTVLAEGVSASLEELFRALFPCGSVTGAPKIRAMEIIHELETAARGIYCGALGWIAPDGDFRFSVPIRTLALDAAGTARLGIGSGIVADSDPADEWAESQLKGRFVSALPPAFELIETLRCEPGSPAPYPLLELHVERLSASAHSLGFRFEQARVREALAHRAAGLQGTHRVRLLLQASGEVTVAATPIDDPAPDRTPTVVVSPLRIFSQDPLQAHKTTVRQHYDGELARAMRDGHFDALFFNERDELVEGARTNVFLDMGDGILLTPPLACGALAGVFRRKLLAEGRAREAQLTARELGCAARIYLANAVRGLVRVDLAG